MLKILVAAKVDQVIARVLSKNKNYKVIGTCSNKEQIESLVYNASEAPDILFVIEGMDGGGRTTDILIRIKEANPNLRIIYAIGTETIESDYLLRSLISLVEHGIYDIYHGKSITTQIIDDLIAHPKSKADMNYLYTALSRNLNQNRILVDDDEDPGAAMDSKDNLIVFSSIRPGSGKSFISTNTAAAIAMYGRAKDNGNEPRVCLVEGDLQTLSIGTVLGVSNPNYNLKEALKQAGRVVNQNGEIYGDSTTQNEVNNFILSCCLNVPDIPNLYALTGSNLTLEELGEINAFQYFYLLDILCDLFDVVIVDANSSLEHTTTGPLLQMAKNIFMILTPDYLSVKVNQRFFKDLKKLGIVNKLQYIVNKSLTESQQKSLQVPLEFDPEELVEPFHPEFSVPNIDPVIAYNHMYDHRPVMMDKSFSTIQARLEIAKLANRIWPVDCFNEFENEILSIKKQSKK